MPTIWAVVRLELLSVVELAVVVLGDGAGVVDDVVGVREKMADVAEARRDMEVDEVLGGMEDVAGVIAAGVLPGEALLEVTPSVELKAFPPSTVNRKYIVSDAVPHSQFTKPASSNLTHDG